jgi:hypothetical protein
MKLANVAYWPQAELTRHPPFGRDWVASAGGRGGAGNVPQPGTWNWPMLKAGICLCITIIVIITAGGATAIDTAGKLRPSQASSANPTLAESGVQLISMPVHGADV